MRRILVVRAMIIAAVFALWPAGGMWADTRCVFLRVRDLFDAPVRDVAFTLEVTGNSLLRTRPQSTTPEGTVCIYLDGDDLAGRAITLGIYTEDGDPQPWRLLTPREGRTQIPRELFDEIDVILVRNDDIERLRIPPQGAQKEPKLHDIKAIDDLADLLVTSLPALPGLLRYYKDPAEPAEAELIENVAQVLEQAMVERPAAAKSIEELEHLLSETQKQLLDAYVHQGSELFAKGNHENAVKAFSRAAELRNDDPVILTGLGLALEATGQNEKAESALRQALDLHKQRLPSDHSDIALSFKNLATLYTHQVGNDQDRKLEELYRECMAFSDSYSDRQHIELANFLAQYRDLLLRQGREAEAQAFDVWLEAAAKRPQVPAVNKPSGMK